MDRYHSENPAVEEAPALSADGRPLPKRRVLFHNPFHQDCQAVIGGGLLEAAVQAGYSEDPILPDVVHTAAARNLIVNAGLTEVVTECVPETTGAGAETSSPKWRPTGCVVVRTPVGRGALEHAEADGSARCLVSLPAHWRVAVTSPERLDAADLEQVTDRRPSQENT